MQKEKSLERRFIKLSRRKRQKKKKKRRERERFHDYCKKAKKLKQRVREQFLNTQAAQTVQNKKRCKDEF